MTRLTAAGFDRLERGAPGFRDVDGWMHADTGTAWGRFVSRQVFRLPVTVTIDAQLWRIHNLADARPYDGLSVLWGHPDRPNDDNWNLNLWKRDPHGTHPTIWQREHPAHAYRKLGPAVRPVAAVPGEHRRFTIGLERHRLEARSDGIVWPGTQPAGQPSLDAGRLVIRADRCHLRLRVTVTEGTATMSDRIAGEDRAATAAAISRRRFPHGGAKFAYLTTGDTHADALALGPLAVEQPGPVLLVQGNRLPEATRLELQRLAPVEVIPVGGPTAVHDAVVQDARKAATP